MQHERETYAVERHKLASHLEQAVKESKDFSSLLRQREEVATYIMRTELVLKLYQVLAVKKV